MSEVDKTTLAEMTTEVVAAYVTANHVRATDMPALIASVHDALTSLGKPPVPEAVAEALRPAVPIRKSITDEYLISLEDGRKLKTMKRYLAGLGMTPAEYRAKWGLPHDYPMMAPAYAVQRSELARTFGLGRKRQREADAAAPETEVQPLPAVAKKPGRRGSGTVA